MEIISKDGPMTFMTTVLGHGRDTAFSFPPANVQSQAKFIGSGSKPKFRSGRNRNYLISFAIPILMYCSLINLKSISILHDKKKFTNSNLEGYLGMK